MLRFPWSVLIDSHKFTFKSLTSTLEHCLLNYQVDRILPSVPPVPTLLIHGEQDSVAPSSMSAPSRSISRRSACAPCAGQAITCS